MRVIYEPNRMIYIGKGHQIKAALNSIAKSSYGRQTVSTFTMEKSTTHIHLGNTHTFMN